jgi:hypothetical protein
MDYGPVVSLAFEDRYTSRDVAAELRSQWRACIEGIRHGDPPHIWSERLAYIAELDEYLRK